MKVIDQISKWFASQCDGDWEHENTIKIHTIDNPGWGVSIDIRNTSLEGVLITSEKEVNDLDWFNISSNGEIFSAFCGVDNLKDVLNFFVNDFRARGDSDFFYDIYSQIYNKGPKIWRPYKATLLKDNSFEIKEIPDFSSSDFKFESIDDLKKINLNEVKDEPRLKVGDIVKCSLLKLADYPTNVVTEISNN
ncbi:MAG: Imm53 family immunity protein [Bacteroidota bacterium]